MNQGRRRAADVVAEGFERLAAVEDEVSAFRSVDRERALLRAVEVDRRINAGESLPFAGVPIGVKHSERSRSVQVHRLLAAGCVPLGTTTVPGPGTPWRTWGQADGGPTRNPWRGDRTPGGSSAGSGVAVATGVVPVATGVDGAGSVRIPAAWCGVLGIKTTGRTAPGPLVFDVADAAAYLQVVSGRATKSRRLSVAWSSDLGYAETDDEQARIAWQCVHRVLDSGAVRFVDMDVRLLDPAPAWYALRANEPARHAENDHRLASVFETVDLVLTPTTPGPPHRHEGPGERINTTLTWAFNVSGHPAATIPAGLDHEGCPVGVQAVARPHHEDDLITFAAAVHAVAPWERPPIRAM
ncbi:amidase [Actinokineospora enzanensis]|uniref:amidase n=1 Tax=Actinokineospora enzanensis TaxID=155975 RepID=UPI0003761494|nr:amidase [Actinokineospora enzanensis]